MSDTWMERARNRMRTLGISQEDLAERLTCTRGAVGHYLAGRRQPSLKQFEVIARALNTDLIWLLYGSDTGNLIREESSPYQARSFRVPVTGKLDTGLKRKPIAFLAVPSAAGNCYALLVDSDEHSPRIFSGETILVDPEQEPEPGDEILIQYRNGRLKLHSFINCRKGQVTVDSIVGEKSIQKFSSKDIKFMHKIIAVFRSGTNID